MSLCLHANVYVITIVSIIDHQRNSYREITLHAENALITQIAKEFGSTFFISTKIK